MQLEGKELMVGRAAYNNPWQTLGHVDTAVYGAPRSDLTHRQVLEQYQLYGDSVLGKYGNNKPNVRDVVKPILGLFHLEMVCGSAKLMQHADIARRSNHFLEAIPDRILDEPLAKAPSSCVDTFANSKNLLPPPYKEREKEMLFA